MKDSSMHFLCFYGYLLDPETKPRWRALRVIMKNFRVSLAWASNQLAWASDIPSAWRNQLKCTSWFGTSWIISVKSHAQQQEEN